MMLVVLLYALFGFTFTLGKLMVLHAKPLFAVGLRMLAGGTILLAWSFTRTNPRCAPQKNDFPFYLQLTIFSAFLPYVLRLWALQEVTVAKASLLFNTTPFFTAVFGYFFLKERLSLLQFTGLCIGFFGTIPILLTSSPLEDTLSFSFISIYELAIIVAAASMSYGFIVTQKLVAHRKCPAFLANGIATFSAGCISLGASRVFEEHPIKTSLTAFLSIMVIQLIISNLICSNLQASLFKKYSPTFISLAGFLSPLFASVYGFLLFHEGITWHFFASFIVTLAGIALYAWGTRTQKKRLAKLEIPL